MSLLLIILMYATWSSVFSLGKLALQYTSPVFLTGFRMAIAGVILLVYLFIAKRSKVPWKKIPWLSLGLLAFFSIYLTNVLEFWGLQYLTAAKTCFLYSLSPFFAAFFSYVHFKEKMNGRKWLGLAIGFLGFIPVLSLQTGAEELWNLGNLFSWPTLAVMGAALCSVYGWVLLRLLVKDDTTSPLLANGASMLIGGLLALTHSAFTDTWNPIPFLVPFQTSSAVDFLQIVLLITVVSNILCYNLYGFLLKRYTATFLSFFGLLSPVFASLHGWVFLGEPLSWTILFSTGIVFIGLWLIYQAELRQGYIKQSVIT